MCTHSLACRLANIPTLVYLPDMSPGVAIRIVSVLAQRVAITLEEVAHYFGGLYPQGKAVVTGYPVREELVSAAQDRAAARQKLLRSLVHNSQINNRDEPPLVEYFAKGAEFKPDAPGTELHQSEQNDLPLTLIWGGSQGARSINQATWSKLSEILDRGLG